MTLALIVLTARQLAERRRALFLILLALIPIAVALLYRFGSDHTDPAPVEFAPDMLDALVLAVVLPLIALVFGTAALGAEIEDGTAVYLLTKPITRWRILIIKIGVSTGMTLALILPSTVIAALITMGGDDPYGITAGFVVAVAVGATAYSALFVALSVRTSRALLIGLVYVFIWEAIVTNILDGTRWISVREYMLGLADLVSGAPPSTLAAELDGASAAVAAVVLITLAVLLGTLLIRNFEIGERL